MAHQHHHHHHHHHHHLHQQQQQHEAWLCSSFRVKACVLTLALVLTLVLALAVYVALPSAYWSLAGAESSTSPPCQRCACNCDLRGSQLLPADCSKLVPAPHEEDEKSLDLLTEELKLKEIAATEKQKHADSILLDAKRLASQYQKEAEKCTSGMETCDQAREKSEITLAAEKEITSMWEKRAKALGWRDPDRNKGLASSDEEMDESDDSAFFR